MAIQFKTGKLAPKLDTRTLKYKSYFAKLPPIPTTIDWTSKITDWLMLANDQYGDCTCASAMHLEMLWTAQTDNDDFIPTAEQTLAAYTAITGFNPQDPNTDNGAVELDVLNYWRVNGFNPGKPIVGYMKVDHDNINHIKSAIALFGGVYAGVQVPSDIMDATNAGEPWTNIHNNNIEGGHAIPLVAYDENFVTCITWGQKQLISYDWLGRYLDETYAVLSPDWIDQHDGLAPSGFNLAQLQADLRLL